MIIMITIIIIIIITIIIIILILIIINYKTCKFINIGKQGMSKNAIKNE